MIKSKTIITATASILIGIGTMMSGDSAVGANMILTGLIAIFMRMAIRSATPKGK